VLTHIAQPSDGQRTKCVFFCSLHHEWLPSEHSASSTRRDT
jgi:hypothetical protein